MKHGKCEELVSQHCGVDVREWAEVSAGRVDDWPVFGRKKVVFERQRWRLRRRQQQRQQQVPWRGRY